MNLNLKSLIWMAVICIVMVSACKKDDEPTTGKLTGVVTDAVNANKLADVRIVIFNSITNVPASATVVTGSDGSYAFDLPAGTYYAKLSKQSYESIPPAAIAPLAFSVTLGNTTTQDYSMYVSEVTDGGIISGKVSEGSIGVEGVLVVATLNEKSYSAFTDKDGKYYIYNVPAASYSLKGWKAEYNSEEKPANVTAATETPNIDIALTKGASGVVDGTVTALATSGSDVDISLTIPNSKEAVPGLNTKTVSTKYKISNVPNGTYLARATYANDGLVIDPDWIVKNGEPMVTVNNNTVTRNFSITGAVKLTEPTNIDTSTDPLQITSTTPTFTWVAYSSANDYVVEVSDANGKVIWGGFSDGYNVKNVTTVQTSIIYNSDGTATQDLQSGKIYRWRIYASKNDNQSPTGFRLISMSEDQKGLIKIL